MIPLRDDNPSQRPPVVTATLIGLCVLVFLAQQFGPGNGLRLIYGLGMIPAVVTGNARLPADVALVAPPLTLVTSMFLHGGWAHLLGNMLYLWIFGNNVEDRFGHFRFLLFYLAAGLAAAAAQVLPDSRSLIPMVGASGAISGVLGAYMVLFPNARVLVFVPISFFMLHYVSAFWLLAIWFALQLLSAALQPTAAGDIAWWAHVGGFIAGWLIALPVRRAQRRRGPWG